jgi:polar amino acid transport system permease protein
METLALLLTWSPFLLQGFVWNIIIAAVAVGLGSSLGALCALLSLSLRPGVARAAQAVTAFSRAVPSLVLIFYLATLVPNTLWIGSSSISIAPWLKAAIALAASPLGFTAWNLQTSIIAWRSGDRRAALLFIPNWMGAFVITLLASSTASLVGVSELLGRCNAVIASSGSGTMLPVYFYGSCVFFVFCSLINFSLDRLKQALFLRVSEGEVDARTE